MSYGISGADPGFQVRGAHLKKLRRAEGGAKIFGVFRVKNHDFTPKNHIFPILGGGARNFWGISCVKSRFYAKKNHFFSNFREWGGGAARRVRPPWIRPWHRCTVIIRKGVCFLFLLLIKDFVASDNSDRHLNNILITVLSSEKGNWHINLFSSERTIQYNTIQYILFQSRSLKGQ